MKCYFFSPLSHTAALLRATCMLEAHFACHVQNKKNRDSEKKENVPFEGSIYFILNIIMFH